MFEMPYLSSRDAGKVTRVAYFDPAEGYVPNPGMGFVGYAHSDHMEMNHSLYPHSLYLYPDDKIIEKMVNLPFVDNIYVRVEWRDVQKQAGKLDLIPVWDKVVDICKDKKKTWSFRVMQTSEALKYPKNCPEFLDDVLEFKPYPAAFDPSKTLYYTWYTGEYFKYWQEMLDMLGDKYDDDPNLAWADISGYGKWGEYHHEPQNEYDDPSHGDIIRKLTDIHMNAFPRTPAVGMCTPWWDDETTSWRDPAKRYAFEKGCWGRRDSFWNQYSMWEYNLSQKLREAGRAYIFEPGSGPWRIHQAPDVPSTANITHDQVYQRMCDFGATYVGLGFNPWEACDIHEKCYDALEMMSKHIGYRIRPAIVTMSDSDNPRKFINIGFANDGIATPPGELALKIEFRRGGTYEKVLPAGFPLPGKLNYIDFELPDDFNDYGSGNYFTMSLTLKTFDKVAPVDWAVKETYFNYDRSALKVLIPEPRA